MERIKEERPSSSALAAVIFFGGGEEHGFLGWDGLEETDPVHPDDPLLFF